MKILFQTVQLRQQATLELESENKSERGCNQIELGVTISRVNSNKSERGYSWIFKSCAREIYILLVLGTVSHYAHRLVNDTRHRERYFANCVLDDRQKKTGTAPQAGCASAASVLLCIIL
jgi:hypothetical protein